MAKEADISNIYFLAGDQELIKTDFINRIKKSLWGGTAQETDLDVFYPDNFEGERLFETLSTGSLFGGKRLVIVKNIEKLNKAQKDAVLDYCANPSDVAVLILETKETNVSKNKFFTTVKTHSKTILTQTPNRQDRQRHLVSMLTEHDIKADQKTIRCALDTAPEDFDAFNQFAVKITLYCNDKKELTQEDIFAVYQKPQEYRAFEILDYLTSGNVAKALEIVKSYRDQGSEGYELIGLLTWVLRKASNPGPARGYGRASYTQKITPRQVQKALRKLIALDYALKRGRIKSVDHIDCFLISLFS